MHGWRIARSQLGGSIEQRIIWVVVHYWLDLLQVEDHDHDERNDVPKVEPDKLN